MQLPRQGILLPYFLQVLYLCEKRSVIMSIKYGSVSETSQLDRHTCGKAGPISYLCGKLEQPR